MAITYTENYNLGKQEDHNDKFDMSVITDNADKIDEALTGKVDKATRIAGLDLSTNISVAELQSALNIEDGANKTVVDDSLNNSSTNPVQNKKVYEALQNKYNVQTNGIPKADLASAVQESLNKADSAATQTQVQNLQSQINEIITPVTEDAEVQNARVGSDGTPYASLKARLDGENTNLEEDISSVQETINKNNNVPIEVEIEYPTNSCPTTTGTFYTDTAWSKKWFGSDYVEIPAGVKKISYCGIAFNDGTTKITPIAFYDENKTFISSAETLSSGNFAPVEGIIDVPYNAKYFYQSKYYASGDSKNSNNYTKYIYISNWGSEAANKIGNKQILCIGDSLTAGVYSNTGTSTPQEKNYPYFMKDVLSNNSIVAGYPGYSARMIWNQNKLQELNFSGVSMIVIMLGTNGGLTDTLETDVIPYDNYTDYADTQTGSYCKIIEYCMVQAPNATIFLCTTPYFDNVKNPEFAPPTTPRANDVIPKIAELYNLFVIDIRHNMGINEKNTAYYQDGDGLHGTEQFYARLGHLIGTTVKSNCAYVD